MSRFLTVITLLMPTFSLLHAPPRVTPAASLLCRTLLYRSFTPKSKQSPGFGTMLEPRYIVGAGLLDQ